VTLITIDHAKNPTGTKQPVWSAE